MTTFTTRELPWIKLGTVIDTPVDATEASALGGLNFEVKIEEAGYHRNGKWHKQSDRRALIRDDTGDFYGFCSTDYKVVQYAEAFDFLDQINPQYVAAGTLRDGRQGFMVVKLPEHSNLDISLKGETDPHDLYVIVRASHDMSKGIEVALITLRDKCMNMLSLPSLTAGAPQRWSIRHIGDPHSKLREAQAVLANTDRYEQAFRSLTRRLVDVQVKRDEVPMLLERVLPDKPQREKQIEAITAAYDGAPTVGFTGTGWGVVNAVSEYFMWERTGGLRTAESTFRDNLDGAAHKYVGRTAQLLLRR